MHHEKGRATSLKRGQIALVMKGKGAYFRAFLRQLKKMYASKAARTLAAGSPLTRMELKNFTSFSS